MGVTGTTLSMLLLGRQGMPRRYMEYLPQFEPYEKAITVSAWVTAAGVAFTTFAFVLGRRTEAAR